MRCPVVASRQPDRHTRGMLDQVRAELKRQFLERDEVVDGLLIALLCRQHVLLLGPPGTAKSQLVRALADRLEGARTFEWLLTKFTTPEELFGPVDLPALEAGRYDRLIDRKLPTAEVAFLDEVFKANSAILNALLTLMNERTFHQGSGPVSVPLETLVAASNELPDEEALEALYDRFLLRFRVEYLNGDARFLELLRLPEPTAPEAVIDREQLSVWRREVDAVEVPEPVLRDVLEIRNRLAAEGVQPSDRRFKSALRVLRGAARLEGRSTVEPADLAWLRHVLWSDPEDVPKVEKALEHVASGFEDEARRLMGQAREVYGYATRAWGDTGSQARAALEAHTKLVDLSKRLQQLAAQAESRGRDASSLSALADEVDRMQANLLGAKN